MNSLNPPGNGTETNLQCLHHGTFSFGPVPAGLREAFASIGNPEKPRSLLRAAIVADSVESFSAALCAEGVFQPGLS